MLIHRKTLIGQFDPPFFLLLHQHRKQGRQTFQVLLRRQRQAGLVVFEQTARSLPQRLQDSVAQEDVRAHSIIGLIQFGRTQFETAGAQIEIEIGLLIGGIDPGNEFLQSAQKRLHLRRNIGFQCQFGRSVEELLQAIFAFYSTNAPELSQQCPMHSQLSVVQAIQ